MFIYCYLTTFSQQRLLLSCDPEATNSGDAFLILFATILVACDSCILLSSFIMLIRSFFIESAQFAYKFIFIYFIINSDIILICFIINTIYVFIYKYQILN
jgi:hypothetical protein